MVIAETISYGRRETGFVERGKANFDAGLNCTTLQSNVTGFVRWRIQFNLRGGETFTFGRFRITIIKSLHSPGGLYMEDITAASTIKKGLTRLFMLAFLLGTI